MAAPRVSVVTPLGPTRGRLPWLAVEAGLIHGAGYSILLEGGWNFWVPSLGLPRPLSTALFLIPLVVPTVLIAAVVARRVARMRTVLGFGVTMMAGFILAAGIVSTLHFSTPVQVPRALDLSWSMLVVAAAALVYGVLAGWFGWWVSRAVLPHVVEQTGTLCWGCGYDRGPGPISVCPECARPAEPDRRAGPRWTAAFDRLAARARTVTTLLLIAFAAWSGWQIFTRILPVQRFYAAFRETSVPEPSSQSPWCWLYVPPGAMPSGVWDGAAACVPFADDPGRGVIVAYWPGGPRNAGGGGVRMRVQYAQMPQPVVLPAGVPPVAYPDEGSTRVYADLDARQARMVVAAGRVPPGLVEALRARAAEVGWNMPAGGAVGLRPVPESAVPASEYFE